jgi:hypothetical protein
VCCRDELLEELLSEREDVVVQRKAAQQAVKALQVTGLLTGWCYQLLHLTTL